jgi:trafficking protein particle complex subunit 8
VGLHAKHAITSLNTGYPASMLVAALAYTVRWDIGIIKQDFLNRELEGERWFVWAAGSVRFSPLMMLTLKGFLMRERPFYLTGRRSTCGIVTRTRGTAEFDKGCS